KDKTVDNDIRYGAAYALVKLGEATKPYVKDIFYFLQTVSVSDHYGEALALGNLGEVAKPYVKDILDFHKDKTLEF
ncbi:MAG: hypothetical protein ACYTXY_52890, partial [Nostoc sp.]